MYLSCDVDGCAHAHRNFEDEILLNELTSPGHNSDRAIFYVCVFV